MEVFLGIALGLSTLLFVGPVFFYLIKSSLEHSVKAGIMAALGIVCGDAIYAGLLYKGFLPLLQDSKHQYWMAIIGATVLLILGILYLTTNGNRKKETVAKSSTPWY
jgi:threonine/homoserine/homoserine lactone efflux protein